MKIGAIEGRALSEGVNESDFTRIPRKERLSDEYVSRHGCTTYTLQLLKAVHGF